MNILIISAGVLPMPPVNGGAVENLINMFLEENEKDHKYNITLYSIFNKKAEIESQKYKSTEFKFITQNSIFYKIQKVLRRSINFLPNVYIGNAYIHEIIKQENFEKYDCIIIENVPEYVLPISKKTNRKIILHLHNDRLNINTKNALKIVQKCYKILVLSNFVGDRVKGISSNYATKVHTLYNGIDTKRFGKEKYKNEIVKLKNKYNIPIDNKVILYTGRIVPEKGVKELVQAFSNLTLDNVKLVIAGSSDYGENKESNYISEIKNIANKNVIFTGYVDYKDIPSLYGIADLGVIPSIWEEPFALTVIEHMATGNPVIIANSGGMKELVNSECAIVVNKGKDFEKDLSIAIENIITNSEKLIKMGKEARKQSEKFTKEIYVNRFRFLIGDSYYE